MNTNLSQPIQRLLGLPDLLDELAVRTKGDPKLKAELDAMKGEQLSAGVKVVNRDLAFCLWAALYLRFNFLDESHVISQAIHSVEGSYWHAIMHRREPDYSNSKYWYRRVGAHPVLKVLPNADPFAFVDFCEAAEKDAAKCKLAVEVQRAEWLALFEHCVRGALNQP